MKKQVFIITMQMNALVIKNAVPIKVVQIRAPYKQNLQKSLKSFSKKLIRYKAKNTHDESVYKYY